MKNFWRTASLALSALFLWGAAASAQDLVPGAYVPAPVGFNVITFYGGFSVGGVSFDPTLPVEDSKARLGSAAVGYARTFGLHGRFASVGFAVPYVNGHLEGLVAGRYQERWLSGLADPTARFAVNLYGARSMTAKEYAGYRARNVVGVSLTMGMPLGAYQEDKVINISRNRWWFKPEIGISATRGHWTIETDIGVSIFTDNTNFASGSTLEQAAIVAAQVHLIYTFKPALWVAMDGNFWGGGRLTTDGVPAIEQQANSRMGVTAAIPFMKRQVRVAYSFGAYTRLGSDFHSLGVSYSHAWR